MNYGTAQRDPIVIGFGALVSSLIVFLVYRYTHSLDRSLVALYPRIVTLELLLDYRFYRSYLRACGELEKRFIDKVESLEPTQLPTFMTKYSMHFRPRIFHGSIGCRPSLVLVRSPLS